MFSIIFIAVLVSILQFTAVNFATIGPYTFNLQIITLVFFSLKRGVATGLGLGLFFGVFNSLVGVGPAHLTIATYLLIGLTVGYAGCWFYRESLGAFLFMVFCALAAVYYTNIPASFFRVFLPAAIYNLVVCLFLFFFLGELKA
jgi:thiamine transporter ThiT